MGADCSLKICPFAIGWADTVEADFNYDNVYSAGGSDSTTPHHGANAAVGGLNINFRPSGWCVLLRARASGPHLLT